MKFFCLNPDGPDLPIYPIFRRKSSHKNSVLHKQKNTHNRVNPLIGVIGVLTVGFKSEQLCGGKHVFVEGAEDNVLFFAVFAKVKKCCEMNGIKAFAAVKDFVLNYDLFNGAIYGFAMYIFEHYVKFVHFFGQPRIVIFVFRYFMSSTQRYIGFYSEQKGTQAKIGIIPHGAGFIVAFLVQQNIEQNRGIKIGYHSSKSVGSGFVISRPEIYRFFGSFGQFWFAVASCQNHSASSSFFLKPFHKGLRTSFDSGSSGSNFCLRSFNSSGFHKESSYGKIENWRYAA